MQSFSTLEVERDGPVLRIWLARPEKRNAASPELLREVGDAFLSLDTDFETRVVVLGGRGKSFCSGMDLSPGTAAAPPRSERERRWLGQIGRRACRAIEDCEIPTVARVQGHAIGGGLCLAASCDFRLATSDASFRLPEVELGLPLSWAATPRLIHEIGAARARELLMLCREVRGEEAAAWGLVHRSLNDEVALDAELTGFAARLLEMPELAIHMTKTQLRGYARRAALGDASETDADMIALAMRSAPFRKAGGNEPNKE